MSKRTQNLKQEYSNYSSGFDAVVSDFATGTSASDANDLLKQRPEIPLAQYTQNTNCEGRQNDGLFKPSSESRRTISTPVVNTHHSGFENSKSGIVPTYSKQMLRKSEDGGTIGHDNEKTETYGTVMGHGTGTDTGQVNLRNPSMKDKDDNMNHTAGNKSPQHKDMSRKDAKVTYTSEFATPSKPWPNVRGRFSSPDVPMISKSTKNELRRAEVARSTDRQDKPAFVYGKHHEEHFTTFDKSYQTPDGVNKVNDEENKKYISCPSSNANTNKDIQSLNMASSNTNSEEENAWSKGIPSGQNQQRHGQDDIAMARTNTFFEASREVNVQYKQAQTVISKPTFPGETVEQNVTMEAELRGNPSCKIGEKNSYRPQKGNSIPKTRRNKDYHTNGRVRSSKTRKENHSPTVTKTRTSVPKISSKQRTDDLVLSSAKLGGNDASIKHEIDYWRNSKPRITTAPLNFPRHYSQVAGLGYSHESSDMPRTKTALDKTLSDETLIPRSRGTRITSNPRVTPTTEIDRFVGKSLGSIQEERQSMFGTSPKQNIHVPTSVIRHEPFPVQKIPGEDGMIVRKFNNSEEIMKIPWILSVNEAVALIKDRMKMSNLNIDLFWKNTLLSESDTLNSCQGDNNLYIVRHRILRHVDRENKTFQADVIDPFSDPKNDRVLMSCGHATTPENLYQFCWHQINGGSIDIKCPALMSEKQCGKTWKFIEIRSKACLSKDEIAMFLEILFRNYRLQNKEIRECTNCGVHLEICYERQYFMCQHPDCFLKDFRRCNKCYLPWESADWDKCQNNECIQSRIKPQQLLQTCAVKTIVGVSGCPVIRACPKCSFLIEHEGDACKHIYCSNCQEIFCFICLSTRPDGIHWQSSCGGAFTMCRKAPIQTVR